MRPHESREGEVTLGCNWNACMIIIQWIGLMRKAWVLLFHALYDIYNSCKLGEEDWKCLKLLRNPRTCSVTKAAKIIFNKIILKK